MRPTDLTDPAQSTQASSPLPRWPLRFAEVFVVVNVVVVGLVLGRHGVSSFATEFWATMRSFGGTWLLALTGGVLVRLIVGRFAKNPRLAPGRDFITDGPRLFLATALMGHAYAWLKLMVPAIHRRNFDVLLWEVDRWCGFGFQPNVFFLTLFSAPVGLRILTFIYSGLFLFTLILAAFWFLTEPRAVNRWGFATGFILVWIVGSWLYVAVPSLGPCFRFPEIYQPYAADMGRAIRAQQMLMGNYLRVLRFVGTSENQAIIPVLGIAAFPSLHVGHCAFLFLWSRRSGSKLVVFLGLMTALMFIGSIVTGWHYMVDSIAGLLLAWGGVAAGSWIARREFGVDPFDDTHTDLHRGSDLESVP